MTTAIWRHLFGINSGYQRRLDVFQYTRPLDFTTHKGERCQLAVARTKTRYSHSDDDGVGRLRTSTNDITDLKKIQVSPRS